MTDKTASNSPVTLDKFRTGKAYTVAQAARLAGTTPATVRRWLRGYEAPGHRMAPVFGRGRANNEGESPLLSFLELVEVVVVARFRQGAGGGHPLALDTLRRAHEWARETFKLPYPFASLDLRESGGHVMHDFDVHNSEGPRLALDLHGQWELPGVVRDELERFEFDRSRGAHDPFALRWYPQGRDVPIVVDPHIAAGRPTILDRGVTLETVARRWKNGERIAEIAQDYELDPAVVEDVLRFAA